MYEKPRLIVRALQSALVVVGAIATCGFVYLMCLARKDYAAGVRNGALVVQVIACWIVAVLACGCGWALLGGVLAVFDTADHTRLTHDAIEELARRARKSSAADPFSGRV